MPLQEDYTPAQRDFNKLTWQTRQFGTKTVIGGGPDKVSAALAGGAVKDAIEGGEEFVRDKSVSLLEEVAPGGNVGPGGGFKAVEQPPNENDNPKYADPEQLVVETSYNRDEFKNSWDKQSNHALPEEEEEPEA